MVNELGQERGWTSVLARDMERERRRVFDSVMAKIPAHMRAKSRPEVLEVGMRFAITRFVQRGLKASWDHRHNQIVEAVRLVDSGEVKLRPKRPEEDIAVFLDGMHERSVYE